MKNIKFILAFVVVGLVSVSCDDNFAINDVNPNAPQFEDVPPRLLLPGAQSQTFRTQATTLNQMGSILTNAWAGNVNSYASPFSREYKLSVDNSFYNGIWDNFYRNVANFDVIIKFANPDHKQDKFIAIAKILKAHYMQYIVDLYGDIPYTQAFLGQSNLAPKYEDDFSIYKALIQELDDARDIIANDDPNALDASASDVMLQGNMTAWRDFANTIELRMLLRMRSSSVSGVSAYVASRVPALSGASFVTSDVLINPGYDNSTDSKQNPFFGTFVFDTSAAATGRTLIVASGHIARILNGGRTVVGGVMTNDPAYAKYLPFQGASIDSRGARMFFRIGSGSLAAVRGVKQGSSTSDTQGSGTSQVSRLGFGITKYPTTSNSMVANAAGRDWAAAQSGVVMLASESYFLQAEAAHFLSGFGGDAQTLFETGIQKSFEYYSVLGNPYGIAAIDATNYINTANTVPGVGWTASATDAQKLEAIMFQKWMALHSIHGGEAYIEYVRTGYPQTPLALTAEQTNKPYRLSYPLSEYVANSSNVVSLSPNQLFSVNSYTPFWKQ